MGIEEQIKQFIDGRPEPKRTELLTLHAHILQLSAGCKLWFDTGINDEGRVVNNTTIGYGQQIIKYAKGNTREFFRIGLSANKTGISVYILGIADKKYLAHTYGEKMGKASITGYCIKFSHLKDIDLDVIKEAIKFGFELKD